MTEVELLSKIYQHTQEGLTPDWFIDEHLHEDQKAEFRVRKAQAVQSIVNLLDTYRAENPHLGITSNNETPTNPTTGTDTESDPA
ncbi:hypothetical protein [Solirubrum puertoriconensis]|uniref:Uncharacterized protein n=1 Tax=Solirubrum puertoriconensis TaxID=1751427 RepID=A0A9X0HK54_SOLP1|nr:hypothetical protein [Solirubrum puertoriconensis]KUG07439.1 hypothetical protein ASU33_13885 [Solirubrum puertoriconensis]